MRAFGNWPRCVTLLRGRALVHCGRTMSFSSSSSSVTAKPPNVLVLQHRSRTAGENGLFQSVKEDLVSCLGSEKYVVYPLATEDVATTPWKDNCRLLVVPATAPVTCRQVRGEVLDFLAKPGSRLLSMDASLNSALGRVNFPRDPAHVCRVVAASPSVTFHTVTLPLADPPPGLWEVSTPTVTETTCVASLVQTSDDGAAGDSPGQPCIHVVSLRGGGHVILSFVDLLPCAEMLGDVSTLATLKADAEVRRRFLRQLLERQLGLECDPEEERPVLSHTYLVCSDERRSEFVSCALACADGGVIKGSEMDVELITPDLAEGTPVDAHPMPSPKRLCIFTGPAHCQLGRLPFDFELYFSLLGTTKLGRTVLYTPVISSTQTAFTGNTRFSQSIPPTLGLASVAGQQTQGKGRSGNFWISPRGCMMFSLPLKVTPGSRLSQHLSIVQHLVALAVVTAVRSLPSYEDLPLCIKWPNDLYYKDEAKLGGILVTTFSMGQQTTAVIGCGVNVSNRHPTISLNDVIALHNKDTGSSLSPLKVEQLLALTYNRLEALLGQYETSGLGDEVEKLYYKYWLHSGSKVRLTSQGNKEVKIVGIDDYGYLKVITKEGEMQTLQPDGNTFDIMKGLIMIKVSS